MITINSYPVEEVAEIYQYWERSMRELGMYVYI